MNKHDAQHDKLGFQLLLISTKSIRKFRSLVKKHNTIISAQGQQNLNWRRMTDSVCSLSSLANDVGGAKKEEGH